MLWNELPGSVELPQCHLFQHQQQVSGEAKAGHACRSHAGWMRASMHATTPAPAPPGSGTGRSSGQQQGPSPCPTPSPTQCGAFVLHARPGIAAQTGVQPSTHTAFSHAAGPTSSPPSSPAQPACLIAVRAPCRLPLLIKLCLPRLPGQQRLQRWVLIVHARLLDLLLPLAVPPHCCSRALRLLCWTAHTVVPLPLNLLPGDLRVGAIGFGRW